MREEYQSNRIHDLKINDINRITNPDYNNHWWFEQHTQKLQFPYTKMQSYLSPNDKSMNSDHWKLLRKNVILPSNGKVKNLFVL